MIDYPSMLLSGSLLIVCIALFFLWMRATGELKRAKQKFLQEESIIKEESINKVED